MEKYKNDKNFKKLLIDIIKNHECKGREQLVCDEINFNNMISIAMVILKCNIACLLINIKSKSILNILKQKYNLYVYDFKDMFNVISNVEIKNINSVSIDEINKYLSFLTPNIDMQKSNKDLFCRISIIYKNPSNLKETGETNIMFQRVGGKTKLEINEYLDKYIIAINNIAEIIKDDYEIISVKKIMETVKQVKARNKQFFKGVNVPKKQTKKSKKTINTKKIKLQKKIINK